MTEDEKDKETGSSAVVLWLLTFYQSVHLLVVLRTEEHLVGHCKPRVVIIALRRWRTRQTILKCGLRFTRTRTFLYLLEPSPSFSFHSFMNFTLLISHHTNSQQRSGSQPVYKNSLVEHVFLFEGTKRIVIILVETFSGPSQQRDFILECPSRAPQFSPLLAMSDGSGVHKEILILQRHQPFVTGTALCIQHSSLMRDWDRR